MKQVLVLTVMCGALGCASQPPPAQTPSAVATVRLPPPPPPSSVANDGGAPEEKEDDEDFMCTRLYASESVPMTKARYRWTMDGRSRSGTTLNGWVRIPCPPGCRIDLEWGPLLEPGESDGFYPYQSTLSSNIDDGTPEEQAAAMLNNLGYDGDLETQVEQFQSDEKLGEHGLVDGKIPPKTWAALKKKFNEMTADPNEPPECKD